MSENRTLNATSVGEPPRHDHAPAAETRSRPASAPDSSHGRRFVDSAWAPTTRGSRGSRVHFDSERLSTTEEQTLAERIKNGDRDATQQLITANLGLVLRAVRQYKHCGVPLDDLIQEGNMGLIRAARRFDPSKHSARFATYATYWIRCYIVRALASHGSIVQLPEESRILRLRYRRALRELRARANASSGDARANPPPPDEIAKYLGITLRRLHRAGLIQGDRNIYLRLGDVVLSDEPAPADDAVTNEDRALVHAAMQRLNPFEAWVICERFGVGESAAVRRIRRTERARKSDQTAARVDLTAGARTDSSDRGPRPADTYYQRSYIEMRKDCGLSVHRLRQVEQTALEKLRNFLGHRTAPPH